MDGKGENGINSMLILQVHHEFYEFVLLLGFAQMIYEKFKK